MLMRNNIAAFLAFSMAVPVPILAPTTGWAQIEEVIVTSRRTEENLQDIPVAVAAFSAEDIEKQGLSTTADVAKLIPGVQFDQGFSAADTRVSIRGINNSRGRTSVAILVDGVDVTGENVTAGGGGSLFNSRLIDLERVEVVKGPQAALYGRNAFAGAINYISKKPSMDGFVVNSYGDVAANYAIYDVRGSISMPVIADKLAVSLNAGAYASDGYYRNHNPVDPVANSGTLGGGDNQGVRLAVLWQATDALTIDATISYNQSQADPRPAVKVASANTFYGLDPLLDENGDPVFDENGQPIRIEVRRPPGTPPDFTNLSGGFINYGQWLGTVGSVSEQDINLSRSYRFDGPFKGSEDDTLLSYARATWEGDAVAFKSLTSFLSNSAFLNEDVDFQNGVGTPGVRPPPNNTATFYSLEVDYLDRTEIDYLAQEFTLESTAWDRGRWLVGVLGFWEDTHNSDESIGWFNAPNFAEALPAFCDATEPLDLACTYRDSVRLGDPAKTTDRKSNSYSIFALVGYDLTDALRLTVEARYIHDEIEVSTNTNVDRVSQYVLAFPIDYPFTGVVLPVTATQRSDTLNPRVALDYSVNDDILVYASAAKGTKPAGFGTAQFATPVGTEIEQERLWGYELGAKSQWLDGRLQVNGALFFNDYSNRQVGVTVTNDDLPGSFPSAGVTNAGGAETKGIELDLQWQATDELTLTLGYAYTDAKWTDFSYTDIRAKQDKDPTFKDLAICLSQLGDCAGADVAGIPAHSMTLVSDYLAPLTEGLEWFFSATAQFEDGRSISDRRETAYTGAYWLVDTRLGIQADNWSAQLYIDNLLDDDTVRTAQPTNDFRDGMYGGGGGEPRDDVVIAFLPSPRVVGVRATWRFGD